MSLADFTASPGSVEAMAAGCRCPVLDNAYGKGRPGPDPSSPPLFVVRVGCPLHHQETCGETANTIAPTAPVD